MAWLDRIHSLDERRLARAYQWLSRLESAIPVGRRLTQFLTTHRPDAVIVSPLVDAASDQVDVVSRGPVAGIPAVAGIAWWDNLTNKGHLRVHPDIVTVWNEQQRCEAVECTALPGSRGGDRGAAVRPMVRAAAEPVAGGFCAMVACRPIGQSCSTPARPSSSRRRRSKRRSRGDGSRRCAHERIQSSPTRACSSGRIRSTCEGWDR